MTNWTGQQQAVISHVINSDRSLVVEAVAGSGKTSTIIGAVEKMRAPANAVVVAFNKAIASEIDVKFRRSGVDWKHCSAKTVHSLGFAAYRKAFGKSIEVDGAKVKFIIDAMVDSRRMSGDPMAFVLGRCTSHIATLVSLAKQSLVGFLTRIDDRSVWHGIGEHHSVFEDLPQSVDPEDIIKWSTECLKLSNENTGTVDFDDMIYLPLLLKCRFWTYDVIFVDEAQDTNAARRALVRASLRKGGKVIAVGDRHQAIYGFTGADADALDLIKQDFNAEELPLSVSFRCGTSIIEHAQQWVPHIQAPAGAPVGSVEEMEQELIDWAAAGPDDVVLCRNNKPLVKLAYSLIRQGIPCYIEGRDVGEVLIKLATKWKITELDQLEERLEGYRERETAKALAKKNEDWAQQIEDRVDTVLIFMDRVRAKGLYTIEALVADIQALFGDTKPGERPSCLTLSSIHKSKGREWETVYWYDKEGTLPSRWARQDWQLGQEDNLCYVATTRAISSLVHVVPEQDQEAA